jgi:hypothetical protein
MPAHTVEIVGPSIEQIRELLGVTGELSIGTEVELEAPVTLRPTAISKSSGFSETELVVQAMVTVATGTTTSLLTAWLKDQLFRKGKGMTVTLDGEELEAEPRDGGA